MGEPYETFDVFLSHARIEAEAVESIGVKLEDKHGLKVWLDRWILIPGEHWQQEMARGLEQQGLVLYASGITHLLVGFAKK